MHAIAPVTCSSGALRVTGKSTSSAAPRAPAASVDTPGAKVVGPAVSPHHGRGLLGVLATRIAWFPLLLSGREVLAREHLDRLAHPSPSQDAQGSSDGRTCAACSVLYLLFGVHLRGIFRRQARQAEAPFCSGYRALAS